MGDDERVYRAQVALENAVWELLESGEFDAQEIRDLCQDAIEGHMAEPVVHDRRPKPPRT